MYLNQLTVLNRAYPYSNCLFGYSKGGCLNECFRKRHNLLRYFYKGDEDANIRLDYGRNDPAIRSHEAGCHRRCRHDNCKLIYFNKNRNAIFLEKGVAASAFVAYPLTTEFDFWLTLIGLVMLFTKISFYQAVSTLLKTLASKLKLDGRFARFRKIVERTISSVKYLIFFASIGYCLVSFVLMIQSHYQQVASPEMSESTIQLLEVEKLTAVFCLDAIDLIFRNSTKAKPRGIFPVKKYFESQTFSELERETDASYKTLKEVYMQFQTKTTKIRWMVDRSKVLFKIEQLQLFRCHQVSIYPVEPKYSSLLAVSTLVLEFNNPVKYQHISKLVKIFLLVDDEILSPGSYPYQNIYAFAKLIVKKSKLNDRCVDYAELRLGCSNREDCIYRCAHKAFARNQSAIPFGGVVIYKNDYDDLQWRTLRPTGSGYILEHRFKQVCRQVLPWPDCKLERFLNSYDVRTFEDQTKFVTLQVYIDVVRRSEAEPSKYKLMIDLLNIQAILFGWNVFQFFAMMTGWLKDRLRDRPKIQTNSKILQICRLVSYAFCLAGFTFHCYFVFKELLTGDLIYNQFYEAQNSVEMSEILICFDTDVGRIDANHRLTGDYLRSVTQDVRIKYVFSRIDYLGEQDRWVSLETNFTNKELSIGTFYLTDKKCFKIKLEKDYHKEQFRFLESAEVLKVFFNQSFLDEKTKFYFFTKKRNTIQFNKILSARHNRRPMFFK